MSPQLVVAIAVEKQGSYTSMSGQLSRHESGVGKCTEQLGRSATDCAPTSDAASKVCSKKRHFIIDGIIFGTASADVYIGQVVEVKRLDNDEMQVHITQGRSTSS